MTGSEVTVSNKTPKEGDPASVPAKYIFEINRGGRSVGANSRQTVSAFLIPFVSDFQKMQTGATHRVWTIDSSAPPFKEHAGVKYERFTLSGTSGFAPRTLSNSDGTNQEFAWGRKSVENLSNFLRDYEEEAAKYRTAYVRNRLKWPNLILNCLWEGESYIVDFVTLTINRNPRSKFSYQWTLTGIIEEQLNENRKKGKLGISSEATAERFVSLILGPEISGVPNITNEEAKLKWSIADLDNKLKGKTTESLVTDMVNGNAALRVDQISESGVVNPVTKAFMKASDITASAKNYITEYRGWLSKLAAASSKTVGTVFTWDGVLPAATLAIWDTRNFINETLKTIAGAPDVVRLMEGEIEDSLKALLKSLSNWDQVPPIEFSQPGSTASLGPAFDPTPTVVPPDPRRRPTGTTMRPQADSTLPWIGRSTGTDWTQLLNVNEMPNPWEMRDGSPLGPDSEILIPRADGLPPTDYGIDLLWDFSAVDLKINDNGDDLVLISGLNNLRQAVMRRATTVEGAISPAPSFGMPKLIGEPSLLGTAGRLALKINESYQSDDRIAKVRELTLVPTATTLTAKFTLVPVGGQPINLSIPYPMGG